MSVHQFPASNLAALSRQTEIYCSNVERKKTTRGEAIISVADSIEDMAQSVVNGGDREAIARNLARIAGYLKSIV